MAIKLDGKIIRNIQEQVEKNKNDIAGWTTLDAFGIKVLGIVATDADIPEGTYNYGDAYLVGTEEPYDIYIYTRGIDNFVNIGPLTIVGPQGPQGPQGLAGKITIGTVTTGDPGSIATVTNSGTTENAILDFVIPRGNTGATGSQGIQGIQGPIGQTGPQGPQGPQGDPGESFMIMGTITNTSQLPDASETPRNNAYVLDDGDPSTPNKMYYITGAIGSEVWSYSSLAAVGTTVTVSGNPVSSWNSDLKVNLSDLFNLIYPVGSYYISDSSENPSAKFGGTWQQIKDRFILAAGDDYTAGNTGGEAAHTLTVNEMPTHNHINPNNANASNDISGVTRLAASGGSGQNFAINNVIENAGGGLPHNNMPPYFVAYIWRRTA